MTQFARPTLNAAVDDGITLSTKLNGALPALYTTHAGAAAPPSPEKGQMWVDTSAETANPPVLVLRQYTGTVWREIGTLNLTTGLFTTAGGLPLTGGTVTGPIQFPSGTAAAPAVTFAGNTNTGIFRIAANQLGFSTNGVQRLGITTTNFDIALPNFRLMNASPAITIDRDAGTAGASVLRFRVGTSDRWAFLVTGAESTDNAGSNFFLQNFNDAGGLIANYLQIGRASRQMGINGAAIGSSTVSIRTNAAAAAEDGLDIMNGNTDLNGSIGINFRTAGGALRGAIRGVRPGNNNGILEFHSATAGVLNKVLTLGSDLWATFEGSVTVNAGLTARTGLSTNNGRLLESVGQGMTILNSWSFSGGVGASLLTHNPNWGDMTFQSIHETGVWAGMQIHVAASATFRFESSGYARCNFGWVTFSDARVKDDVQPITDALTKLEKIGGYTYDRTDFVPLYTPEHLEKNKAEGGKPLTNPPARRWAGFLAQEVRAVLPEAVQVDHHAPICDPDGEGMHSLDSVAVLALAVQAIKEQQAIIKSLESRLAALEAK